ncbi:MAG: hypothetical protein F6K42_14410, partial [Leptolyngbya sp. SIO1D8]|nr:hypothetical protein [Leptolyngbya sp. SIO1D8]
LLGNSQFWFWWPLVNSLVWLVGVGWFLDFAEDKSLFSALGTPWQWMAQLAMCGFIIGLLKGLSLVWFLKQAPKQS